VYGALAVCGGLLVMLIRRPFYSDLDHGAAPRA